jgi:hypothetical protein
VGVNALLALEDVVLGKGSPKWVKVKSSFLAIC